MNLNIFQGSGICLTPELKNGIQILSMSGDDLEAEVNRVFEKNIFLEQKPFSSDYSMNFSLTDDIISNAVKQISLQEYILDQVAITTASDKVLSELIQLSYLIMDNGRFPVEAKSFSNESINIIRSFEPSGVGGFDLTDTLTIQAMDLGLEIETDIIISHLNDVATNNTAKISKEMDLPIDDIDSAIANIKRLNPQPGYNISVDSYIQPDGYIRIESNLLDIGVYNKYSQIQLIHNYKDVLSLDRKFKDDLLEAKHLISSIKYRDSTLLSVLSAISSLQRKYLLGDKLSLKPMTMSTIADICSIHESTVSRLCSSKYIETSLGIISLRQLFTNGLTNGDSSISSHTIKKIIKDEISVELPTKPISDAGLTDKLNEKGIEISRRTVSKYRQSMDIPSSINRKLDF